MTDIPGLPDDDAEKINTLKQLNQNMRDTVGENLHDIIVEAGYRYAADQHGPWED